MAGRAGLVLAGGRSSRMGTSKAALEWHGSTLVRRTLGVLARGVDGPVLVVRAPGQRLPEIPPDARVVEDPEEGLGPLQGIAAGLAALSAAPAPAPHGAPIEVAFVCATDLPFLHPVFVRRVLGAVTDDVDVALPVVRGYPQPLAAAYRVSLAPLVADLVAAGDLRPAFLFRRCRTLRLDTAALLTDPALAEVDPELESVRNVNSREEYRAARNEPAPRVTVRWCGVDGHRETWAVHAATVAEAAAVVGLTVDGDGVATVNGDPISRAGDVPLATGDTVTFPAPTFPAPDG